ncbi:uncharacterized protein LOC128390769 [Panonychus citri]|uniref:uncharacterized protein LOC128390769 n=1 Tax=Panonychus citri TaxID=50023 RepID=UPI002307C55D|nr:uncharacterized protein LOC128390769 [Panonychus citri]
MNIMEAPPPTLLIQIRKDLEIMCQDIQRMVGSLTKMQADVVSTINLIDTGSKQGQVMNPFGQPGMPGTNHSNNIYQVTGDAYNNNSTPGAGSCVDYNNKLPQQANNNKRSLPKRQLKNTKSNCHPYPPHMRKATKDMNGAPNGNGQFGTDDMLWVRRCCLCPFVEKSKTYHIYKHYERYHNDERDSVNKYVQELVSDAEFEALYGEWKTYSNISKRLRIHKNKQ